MPSYETAIPTPIPTPFPDPPAFTAAAGEPRYCWFLQRQGPCTAAGASRRAASALHALCGPPQKVSSPQHIAFIPCDVM